MRFFSFAFFFQLKAQVEVRAEIRLSSKYNGLKCDRANEHNVCKKGVKNVSKTRHDIFLLELNLMR